MFLKNGVVSVKIGDVGLARVANPRGNLYAGYGGAMFYLAPEVLKGSFSPKVDVFSFGIMM